MKNSSIIILTFLLTTSAFSLNRWQTHGHNYSYTSYGSSDSTVIFPVAWDVRSANNLILAWQDIYGFSSNPVSEILEDSYKSGFNAALIRSELTDKQFPEQPGDPGDEFFPMAGTVRGIGLHLIVGGLKTALDESVHNQKVLDYLKLYIPQTNGNYTGDVIGSFAFDEPDVKYLAYPDQADNWLNFVSYWNEAMRTELNLPVISYHAKYGTPNSSGYLEYYTDTTSVLNRMARYTDVIAMDMYPVKNSSRRKGLLQADCSQSLFTVATDLIQTNPVQIQALNSRDELIRVFSAEDTSIVEVQNIDWNGYNFSLETAWTLPLAFVPDFVDASDFRAGFAIQESPGYVNSAVVLWKDGHRLSDTVVLLSEEGMPIAASFPEFSSSSDFFLKFVVVGQTDYWADILEVQGIIGQGRLTILTVLSNNTGENFVMLFTAEGEGSSQLVPVFTQPLSLNFSPVDGVWGSFWGTWYEMSSSARPARSGFVIFDENGDYLTINQTDRYVWSVHPYGGSTTYSNLFETGDLPEYIRVSRADSNSPPFFAGLDYLVGWFEDTRELISIRTDIPGNAMRDYYLVEIDGLPEQSITGFDFLRNDIRYFDSFLFTVNGGDVYSSTSSIQSGYSSGNIEVELNGYSYGDTVLSSARVMHTRDAYRSVLLPHADGYYIPYSQLWFDRVDDWRFQWYPEAHQVGFDLGVEQTERKNSMFAVIQSYGRHAFALPSYCASPDTMLYLTTAPIVAGARGLIFYALDLSMMSGNGGNDGIERAPFVFQNWGPSKDTKNTDMVDVVHSAVARLSGNTGGTDYLSILVNPEWTPLTENDFYNSSSSDTLLNFLALQNSAKDSIIVITVNESATSYVNNSSIVCNDLPFEYLIASSEGFEPNLVFSPASNSLQLDFSGMPSVCASLVTLTINIYQEPHSGSLLSTSTYSTGQTNVVFTLPEDEHGSLQLFDLYGRKISTLWSGIGSGSVMSVDITRGAVPSGLYFVRLTGLNTNLSGKCYLW